MIKQGQSWHFDIRLGNEHLFKLPFFVFSPLTRKRNLEKKKLKTNLSQNTGRQYSCC